MRAKRGRSETTGSGSQEVHGETPRTHAGGGARGGPSQGTSVGGQAKVGRGRTRRKPKASSSSLSSVRENTSGDVRIVDKAGSRQDGRDKHDSSASRGVGRSKRAAGCVGGASTDVSDRTMKKEGRDEAPAEREVSADGIASKMRAGEEAAAVAGGPGIGVLPGRWIHVDPVHGAVDQADKARKCPGTRFAHVRQACCTCPLRPCFRLSVVRRTTKEPVAIAQSQQRLSLRLLEGISEVEICS